MKIQKFLISLVILVGLVSIATAQTKRITAEAYNAAMDKASKANHGRSRRSVKETKDYKSGQVSKDETLTIETLPNEDAHWIGLRTVDSNTEQYLDLRYLGKFEYRKENGGAWQKRCFKDCTADENTGGFMTLSGEEPKNMVEYLAVDTVLNGQKCTLYVSYKVYDLGNYFDFMSSSVWIDSTGLKIKEAFTMANALPSNFSESSTTTYEYDVKDIKAIEVPKEGS